MSSSAAGVASQSEQPVLQDEQVLQHEGLQHARRALIRARSPVRQQRGLQQEVVSQQGVGWQQSVAGAGAGAVVQHVVAGLQQEVLRRSLGVQHFLTGAQQALTRQNN